MIRVLMSWDDLGKSIQLLKGASGYHTDPMKNWDLAQVDQICEKLPKTARILDAGCSESYCSVLRYLNKKGFKDLVGIDLHISFQDRLEQFVIMKNYRTIKPPFRLYEGDITKTNFTDRSFDAIVCLSVIEHGVDISAFMNETSRLLKTGGILYVSTDYWPDKINSENITGWGLKWTIFSRHEIEEIIKIASKQGLVMDHPEIPESGKPIVKWSGREYTFLSMVFRKE